MLWWSWMSQCQCHWTLVSFSLSITPCSMICLFVLADTISAVIIWLAFNGQNIVIKNLLQWDSLSTQHCPHGISYTGTGLLSMHLVKSCLSTRIIDAADGVGSGHIPLRHSPSRTISLPITFCKTFPPSITTIRHLLCKSSTANVFNIDSGRNGYYQEYGLVQFSNFRFNSRDKRPRWGGKLSVGGMSRENAPHSTAWRRYGV